MSARTRLSGVEGVHESRPSGEARLDGARRPTGAVWTSLAAQLADADGRADDGLEWPATSGACSNEAGATRWSLLREFGGDGLPPAATRFSDTRNWPAGASRRSSSCRNMTRAFAGCWPRRKVTSPHRWLQAIGEGRAFTTVGISHLTTSRRLGAQPVKAVEVAPGVYRLDGTIPWVTAAERADVLVTGAVLDDGRQMLIALPADRPGVDVRPPFPLAALQASCTTEVVLEGRQVDDSDLLAGPGDRHHVESGRGRHRRAGDLGAGAGSGAGGTRRLWSNWPRIGPIWPSRWKSSAKTGRTSWGQLIAQARGDAGRRLAGQIRTQANALVLRSTQAYLTAQRGTGFLRTEPAQRWARQALFFLVWSCPTPVAQAAIRRPGGVVPGVNFR